MSPKPLHKSRTVWSVVIAAVTGLIGFLPLLPQQLDSVIPLLPDSAQRWLRLLSATSALAAVVFAKLASQDVKEALAGEKTALDAVRSPN